MNNAIPFLCVAVGGAAGSVARYATSLALHRWSGAFPIGTLAANLGGCRVIGILAALAERGGILGPQTRTLLMTGFCGGFTTLSTFQYELAGLADASRFGFVGAYAAATVVGGFACFYLGQMATRALVS